jgi:uncharacterized membrane-anchored protein
VTGPLTKERGSCAKVGAGTAIAAACQVAFFREKPTMVVLLSLVISAGVGAAALLVIRRSVARENAAAVRDLDRI